jgi:anti-anti-sigma factor
MNLTATVRQIGPATSIVDLQGVLNAQSEGVLMEAHRQAGVAGARCLILNFSALAHINSAGLGRLVALLARASRLGQRLLACGWTEQHRQIFNLTRLDEAIELYTTESEAVAAVSATGARQIALRPSPAATHPAQHGWAAPVSHLVVTEVPAGVVNLNVQGRQLSGPIRGFGQLWQKTYEIRLAGAVTPPEVIWAWKNNFASFWPKGNRFYGRASGLQPGDVAVLHLAGPGGLNPPGGLPLICTGLMVIYVDDESFAFMASEGHTIAGMITFTAFEENGTVVRVEALFRPNDPLFEAMFRLGIGGWIEDDFWKQSLRNLARHFNVQSEPRLTAICLDPRLQWSEAWNIWQNAALHTGFYILGAPFRWVGGLFQKRTTPPGG